MLSPNSLPLISFLSVLLALPLASAAPAAYRRDLSYDDVRDAVVALPAAMPRYNTAPGSGANLAVDHGQVEPASNTAVVGTAEYIPETLYTPDSAPSAPSILPGAQVLAADAEGEAGGYWQIFTTSRWIGERRWMRGRDGR